MARQKLKIKHTIDSINSINTISDLAVVIQELMDKYNELNQTGSIIPDDLKELMSFANFKLNSLSTDELLTYDEFTKYNKEPSKDTIFNDFYVRNDALLYRGVNYYFSDTYRAYYKNNTLWHGDNQISPASEFARLIVNKISTNLFKRLPDIYTYTGNEQGKLYIYENESDLENIFTTAINDYIIFGRCLIRVNGAKLENVPYYKWYPISNNKYVYLPSENTTSDKIIYHDNNESIIVDNLTDGLSSITNVLNYNSSDLMLLGRSSFSSLWSLFVSLEKTYLSLTKAVKQLTIKAVVHRDLEELFLKVLNEDSELLSVKGALLTGENRTEFFQYIDNTPIVNTVMGLFQTATGIKQQIVDMMGIQDLFSLQQPNNPSESKETARNRISQQDSYWEKTQKCVNNYTENVLKINLTNNNIADTIEIDARTINEKENDLNNFINFSNTIVQNCIQSLTLPDGLGDTFIDIQKHTVDISPYPKKFKDELLNSLNTIKAKINEASKNKEPDLPTQKLQSEIEENKADVILKQTQAQKYQSEIEKNMASIQQENEKIALEKDQKMINLTND